MDSRLGKTGLQVLLWGMLAGLLSCAATGPLHQEALPVTHVVILWMKDPRDKKVRQEIIQTAESFRQIPGVLDVQAGKMLSSPRPQVDSSYDLAVVIRFEDENSLRMYEKHPVHQDAVQRVLKPHVRKIQVYDFQDNLNGLSGR